MIDPRETLFRKETDYMESEKLEVDDDEEIQNALKEIERHENEIRRLKELVNKWRKERSVLLYDRKRKQLADGTSKRRLLEFNNKNENFDIKQQIQRIDDDNSNTRLMKNILKQESRPNELSNPSDNSLQKSKFLMRNVHAFYNDELFANNRDNKLKFKTTQVDERCGFSGKTLSLRYIPKSTIEKIVQSYTVITLQRLFQLIRPPDYSFASSSNFAIVGIVHEITPIKITQRPIFNKESNISIDEYSSSKQKMKKAQAKAHMVNKHFNIKLTDLKHTVVVTVHGQALIQAYYTSLKPGDLIMIDSPTAFKFSNSYEKYGFGLSITEDSGRHQIMEVGKVSNYSRCDRVVHNKANSTEGACGMFYDNQIQKCCDYHQEKDMESGLSRRMELNSGFLGRRISQQERQINKQAKTSAHSSGERGGRNHGIIGMPDKTSLHFKNEAVAARFFNAGYDYNEDAHSKIDPKVRQQMKREKRDNVLLLKKLAQRNKGKEKDEAIFNRGNVSAIAEKSNAIKMLNAAVKDKKNANTNAEMSKSK